MVPLPPYARRVEYLESTGTQWIDTGVSVTSEVRAQIRFLQRTKVSGENAIFGNYLKRPVHIGTFVGLMSKFSSWHGPNTTWNFGGAQTEEWINVQYVDSTSTGRKCVVNGVEYTDTDKTSYWANGQRFALFASGIDMYSMSVIRVSSCKIYADGTLVRSFVPCRILDTGYLWDEVNGVMYGNSGTGDFVLGPDVREGVVPTRLNPFGIGRRMSDVPCYEDGAVMILDGIFNVGVGRHSSESSTTSWKDLVGGHDATLTRASNGWTTNSLNTKVLTGGTASTVAAGAFPGIPFAENTTVEMVFRVDQAQNANGEVIVFVGGYDRFGFSFVSGGTAGNLIIATTPDTRIAVDMSDPGVDSDICDLGKVHHFCVVFGESDSLTGWSLYHNGSVQPLYVRGGNLGAQSDGTGTIVGRTNSTNVPNNANGQILAFRVYNRALTQAEISNHWLVDRDRFGIRKIVQ